ncbi:MAG: glutamine-hydrolyzing carbamoyl-phosphate synthase small subunit [Spirochaetota bacterium]
MKAILMLENGVYQECESFTGGGEVFGELVFNTGLTGYQEIITDPSYHGQIVLMTNTMIGNYGIRENEDESMEVQVEGFVVKEYSGTPFEQDGSCSHKEEREYPPTQKNKTPGQEHRLSPHQDHTLIHNRITSSLAGYLKSHHVLGVEGPDTRFLTRHIREKGAMKAGITTQKVDRAVFLKKVQQSPSLIGRDLVKEATPDEPYVYCEGQGYRIAVIDCGVKLSTLRHLALRGCRVEVFPAQAARSDIMKTRPQGVLISNGPGDPAPLTYLVELVDSLIGEVPVFGICLGHQIIGQGLGAETYKLKFGHHGGNHPVRSEKSRKVFITTQNHGFAVDTRTLPSKEVDITFINLNDHTLEGLSHKKHPLFSVQFHPEAAPGPHDTFFLFDDFIHLIGRA